MVDDYVPEEIVSYILARFPAKPLARFKCVSRNWNRLISDSGFMKRRERRMILLPVHPFQAIDKTETDADLAYTMVNLHSPFVHDVFFIVGTFNGIILLVHRYNCKYDDMILYNPLTQALKIVTYPYSYGYFVCGFGYDTTPDDLKIVRLRVNIYDNVSSRSCDVYSLKNGSWSTPSDLIGSYKFQHHSGKFVNGFLYWLAVKRWFGKLIIAFDVKEMIFSEIGIPLNCSRSKILGTFKGSLCIGCDQTNNTGYELWVMNNHGFWESCLKLRYETLSPRSNYSEFFKLSLLDEGKVVMRNPKTKQIVIFDMLKRSDRDMKTLTCDGVHWTSQAIEYVESWVSPFDLCSS